MFRAHKMPTAPVTVRQSINAPIKSNIALIHEKPLVRAAFLLCKKVQVFVSFDVAHYTSKLLAFSQIAQNAPRMGASPYASTKTCTFATAPSCEREACS